MLTKSTMPFPSSPAPLSTGLNQISSRPNPRNPPAWQYSYTAFLEELRTNFGPFDAIGDAEDALEHLRMCDGDQIMKYMVQFNQYASQVGYGDNSLRHAFYHGLCTRIKDDMAHHGKLNNLCDMRFLAQELDACYWDPEDQNYPVKTRKTSPPVHTPTTLNPRVPAPIPVL